MFQTKVVQANQNILFSITVFSENRAFYEVMWKNIVQPHISNIMRRIRFACCIVKATDTHTYTHTEYVIFISFPRRKWFRERASILRVYTYIACLSCYTRPPLLYFLSIIEGSL